jgi:hypothetical protein
MKSANGTFRWRVLILKVFDRPFSKKVAQVEGVKPSSRPQARNTHNGVFGSFCACGVKKNGNGFLT